MLNFITTSACRLSSLLINAKRIRLLSLMILLIANTTLSYSQTVKLITYNIRYDNSNDAENSWSERKEKLAAQIKFYEPDIFGIQEGLYHQVNFLDNYLGKYNYAGVGREDGKTIGEFSAIFFNAKRFKLLESSTFWLSETPDTISIGWDAVLPRICTYVYLKDNITGKKIWVFNTHLDHIGKLARINSAKLIVKRIKSLNKLTDPVILMGDFNSTPDSKVIKYLSAELNDSKYSGINPAFGPEGTFNGFKFHEPVTERIDYIFSYKEKTLVNKYAVLSDSKDCKYPSDHLPVFIEILLR